MAVAVGTWSFSESALKVIAKHFTYGYSYIDALEKGINAVEENPETGPYFVGRGGYPNSSGVLECDAALMVGDRCQFGAVAGLQGVAAPFSVARLVLERSPHSMITGNGAKDFAKTHGVTIENQNTLQTVKSQMEYQKYKSKQRYTNTCCDTLGVIVLDGTGHFAAGVSSSGMPFKSPGRVGDSPLPGSGLYADNEVGAAVASGDGDRMMCFCPSFHVVQMMKQKTKYEFFIKEIKHAFEQGHSPQEACEGVIQESQRKAGTVDKPFEMALLAVDKMGSVGAATTISSWQQVNGTRYDGFPYTVWRQENGRIEIKIQPPLQLHVS